MDLPDRRRRVERRDEGRDAGSDRRLPVLSVGLEHAEFPAAEADLLVAWHVLEHLEEPRQALRLMRDWLAPGGQLVVAVPNLGSVQARIGGDRWFHQDVPRHRTHFTPAGIGELLRRSGYEPMRFQQVMLDQNVLGMWLTLLNRLTEGRDVPFRFLKRDLRYPRRVDAARDAVVAAIAGIPLLPIAALLELGCALLGRGGSVVVEAGRA